MFERLSDEEIRLAIKSNFVVDDDKVIAQAQLKKTLQDVIEWIENHADIDTWRKRSCFIIFPEHLQELKDQVERMK